MFSLFTQGNISQTCVGLFILKMAFNACLQMNSSLVTENSNHITVMHHCPSPRIKHMCVFACVCGE